MPTPSLKQLNHWRTTAIFLSIFTVVSATFARQALNTSITLAQNSHLKLLLFFTCFVLSAIVINIIYQILKKHALNVPWFKILLVFLLVGYTAYLLPIFDERIHLLEYGLVALTWATALSKDLNVTHITFAHALFTLSITLMTGTADELLQAFLPYRVGDPRDVVIDLIGGCTGLAVWGIWRQTISEKTQVPRSTFIISILSRLRANKT
jgi:hypothetical protein